jgi:hypothetical protein
VDLWGASIPRVEKGAAQRMPECRSEWSFGSWQVVPIIAAGPGCGGHARRFHDVIGSCASPISFRHGFKVGRWQPQSGYLQLGKSLFVNAALATLDVVEEAFNKQYQHDAK